MIIRGYAIVQGDELAYGDYTYFSTDREELENILDDVRGEFPSIEIVSAVLGINSADGNNEGQSYA